MPASIIAMFQRAVLNGIVIQGDHCMRQNQHLFVHKFRSGQEPGAMPLHIVFAQLRSRPQDEDTGRI